MSRSATGHDGALSPTGTATPRFLCDEMLEGLAHWLRAAGYDTALAADGRADVFVAEQARAQQRMLLTRDRQLAQSMSPSADGVVLLNGNGLDAWAAELSDKLALDWTFRPFSRCLVCNTLLQPAVLAQYARLPPMVRHEQDVRYCPTCDKLYWEGSHVRRMRSRLWHWQQSTPQE